MNFQMFDEGYSLGLQYSSFIKPLSEFRLNQQLQTVLQCIYNAPFFVWCQQSEYFFIYHQYKVLYVVMVVFNSTYLRTGSSSRYNKYCCSNKHNKQEEHQIQKSILHSFFIFIILLYRSLASLLGFSTSVSKSARSS